jgi:hypothetical protein
MKSVPAITPTAGAASGAPPAVCALTENAHIEVVDMFTRLLVSGDDEPNFVDTGDNDSEADSSADFISADLAGSAASATVVDDAEVGGKNATASAGQHVGEATAVTVIVAPSPPRLQPAPHELPREPRHRDAVGDATSACGAAVQVDGIGKRKR